MIFGRTDFMVIFTFFRFQPSSSLASQLNSPEMPLTMLDEFSDPNCAQGCNTSHGALAGT